MQPIQVFTALVYLFLNSKKLSIIPKYNFGKTGQANLEILTDVSGLFLAKKCR